MKTTLSLLIVVFSVLSIQAQDYCLFNSQKAYNIGFNTDDEPFEVLEQPDGKLIVVGTSYYQAENSFHISAIRVFPNGNLDPTFGELGRMDVVFSSRNTGICADLLPDGKFIVGGYQYSEVSPFGIKPYVARFNEDGTPDASFGDGGSTVFDFLNPPGESQHVKGWDNGKIQVVMKSDNNQVTVARLLEDGQLDTSYANNGIAQIESVTENYTDNPSSLILEDSTTIAANYLYASTQSAIVVNKFLPNGDIDTNFGDNGISTITDNVYNLLKPLRTELAFDGNYLITAVDTNLVPMILKVDANTGELFASFGDDGILTAPILAQNMSIFDIVKDEANQEWVLLFGGVQTTVGTMRIDDNGNIVTDCNSSFQSYELDGAGTKYYLTGLIDQAGNTRIFGQSGFIDETSEHDLQTWNYFSAYYTSPSAEPSLFSVSPNTISLGVPVTLNVSGTGLTDAESVLLTSTTDTLIGANINIFTDEELEVTINPINIAQGMRDLVVHLPNDTLVLEDAVEVVGDIVVDADVQMLSRIGILLNGNSNYTVNCTNTGTQPLIAAPLVVANTNPYSVDFSAQPIYDYTQDPEMSDFMDYLISQGIDVDELNNSQYADEDIENHIFLTTNFSPNESFLLTGLSTITELVVAPQSVYLNPNGFVGVDGLTPDYAPQPSNCTQEIVFDAFASTFMGFDDTQFASCFETAYTQMQLELAARAQEVTDDRLIPFKGSVMKMCYNLMSCIDADYNITMEEFNSFHNKMASAYATNIILIDEFPCEDYVAFTDNFQGEAPSEDDLSPASADKADPWGLGINFYHCMGCVTYNHIEGQSSIDPNEKIGPVQGVTGSTSINTRAFNYTIHFENVDSAQIPAKTVFIVDSLDTEKFDLSTLEFTYASAATKVVPLTGDVTEVDLRPEQPHILRITTNLDEVTGVATWLFESLDTLSLYPTEDIDLGFLPPNVNAPEGMGYVSFNVDLKEDVESGAIVENNALIYFDYNDPIVTNTFVNTFDNTIPSSMVNEIVDYVPGENEAIITWQTEEPDPGIWYYNVYYNTDGSNDWTPWLAQTTETQAVFTGDFESTYYFMCIAVDYANNVEAYPEIYDASIYFSPVSISELDTESGIELYPNPALNQAVIQSKEYNISHVQFRDASGKLVKVLDWKKGTAQAIIPVDELESGIYFIEVMDRSKTSLEILKMVKL